MCKIALRREEDLRNAFSRVKTDINDLRRSINRRFFRLEEIEKKTSGYTLKEEFYSFIQNLSNKLDSMESELASKKEISCLSQDLKEELESVKRALQRREGLKKYLELVRKLDSKLIGIEGSFVSKKGFNEDFDYLNKEITNIKKQFVKEPLLRQALSQLEEFRKKITGLEKMLPEKEELSRAREQQEQSIRSLKEDLQSISLAVSRLEETDTSEFVTRKALKRESLEAEDRIKKLEEKRAEIVSRLDRLEKKAALIDETKKSIPALDKKLKKIEEESRQDASGKAVAEFDNRLRKLDEKLNAVEDASKKAEENEDRINTLKKDIEKALSLDQSKDIKILSDKISKIEQSAGAAEQIKFLKKDVDYLTNNLVTQSELNSYINSLNEQIESLRKELKKTGQEYVDTAEIEKRASEIAVIRLKELIQEQAEKKPEIKEALIPKEEEAVKVAKTGVAGRLWKSFGDFLKEDEAEKPEKTEAKEPAGAVQEQEIEEKLEEIKGEVAKEARPQITKWVVVAVVVLIAGYFFVFKMPQYKYAFFIVAFISAAAALVIGKEEEPAKEKAGGTINLEEFFRQSEEPAKPAEKKRDGAKKEKAKREAKKSEEKKAKPRQEDKSSAEEKTAEEKTAAKASAKEEKAKYEKKETKPKSKKGFMKRLSDVLFEDEEKDRPKVN